MLRSNLLSAGACVLALSGCANPQTFQAALSGAQQVPANSAAGTGTMTARFQPDTMAMTYNVQYTGLSGPATGAHIHGPAGPGANAPVIIPFANAASPITGGVTLTRAQADQIAAGQSYVNIHTAANPNGEIRGQIARTQ